MRRSRGVLLLACLFLASTSALAGCGDGEGPAEKTGKFGQALALDDLVVTPTEIGQSVTSYDAKQDEWLHIDGGRWLWVTVDLRNAGSQRLKVTSIPWLIHDDGSQIGEGSPPLYPRDNMADSYVSLGGLAPLVIDPGQTLHAFLSYTVSDESPPVSRLQILCVFGDDPGKDSPQVKGTWDLEGAL